VIVNGKRKVHRGDFNLYKLCIEWLHRLVHKYCIFVMVIVLLKCKKEHIRGTGDGRGMCRLGLQREENKRNTEY
jgi:hypothetical protein